MTQVVERPITPLIDPVPGAWLQFADRSLPPVYVPFEPVTRKNEATGKDEVIGHGPGAHVKRLLSEGAMYANGPVITQQSEPSTAEAALRAELEQMRSERERFMAELSELREKMAGDANVPNASKRAR